MRVNIIGKTTSAMLALVSIAAVGEPRFDGTDWEALIHTTGKYVIQSEIAPTPASAGRFGAATAMWHDAATGTDWAVIGAPSENASMGAAYIFSLASGATTWHAEQKLTASDSSENSAFGFSVAMDGDTIAIGAPTHESDFFVGAAYVFVRNGTSGVWTQQGDELNVGHGYFGYSLALRGDMLAVGDPANNTVSAFNRTSGAWSPFATLPAPTTMFNPTFGTSVALDDSRLLVGAPTDSELGRAQGAAVLYSKSRDSWDLQQILAPQIDTSNDQLFGSAIAMSKDFVVIGGPSSIAGHGAAHVFANDPMTSEYVEQFLIRPSSTAVAPHFGSTLAMSDDLLVIGDPGANRCDVYRAAGGAFAPDSTLIGDADTNFGHSIAVSNDKVLVGAIGAKTDSDGDAFVFQSDRIFADGLD